MSKRIIINKGTVTFSYPVEREAHMVANAAEGLGFYAFVEKRDEYWVVEITRDSLIDPSDAPVEGKS